MSRVALVLSRDEAETLSGFDEVFLWDGSATDSFKSQLRPSLASIGPVSSVNADFVRIALAIFATDHSVPRKSGGSDWNQRTLFVTVPVSDPGLWERAQASLVALTNYLTGDLWDFSFFLAEKNNVPISMIRDNSKRVVLLSGGADSAIGALFSAHGLSGNETQTLVSHSSSGPAAGTPQRQVAQLLEGHYPERQFAHHQLFLNRVQKRIGGTKFRNEPSSRSRSLLFLALGLAVAGQSGNVLWIPENGFASLNPPLGPERIGALSTRTTQPWFLQQVSELLKEIGAHGEIENPFQRMTKGEMFRQVSDIIGAKEASTYLSSTNSCSHTNQQYQRVPSGTHCGVCFGCIVRRASFKASGIIDQTRYLSDEGSTYDRYVQMNSILEAIHDFVDMGVNRSTIMAMPLPVDFSGRQALELCERGLAEMADYIL